MTTMQSRFPGSSCYPLRALHEAHRAGLERPSKEAFGWGAFVVVLLALVLLAWRTLIASTQPLMVLVLPILFGVTLATAVVVRDAIVGGEGLPDLRRLPYR